MYSQSLDAARYRSEGVDTTDTVACNSRVQPQDRLRKQLNGYYVRLMRRSESEAKNAAWWLKLSKGKHLSHKQKEELERLSEQWKAWADKLRTHAFAIIGAPFAEPKPKQPKQPKPKKERKPKAPKPKKERKPAVKVSPATRKAWQAIGRLRLTPAGKAHWAEIDQLEGQLGEKPRIGRIKVDPKASGAELATQALMELYRLSGYVFAKDEPKQAALWKDRVANIASLAGLRSAFNVQVGAVEPKKPAKKPRSALQEQAKTLQKLHELHKKEGEIARKESEKREAKRKKELRENFERNKRDATKDSYYLLDVVRANRPAMPVGAVYAINDIEGMLPNRPPRVPRVKEASKHLDGHQLAYDLERLWRKWVYFFPNDKALQTSWQTHVKNLAEALSLKNYFNPDKRLS